MFSVPYSKHNSGLELKSSKRHLLWKASKRSITGRDVVCFDIDSFYEMLQEIAFVSIFLPQTRQSNPTPHILSDKPFPSLSSSLSSKPVVCVALDSESRSNSPVYISSPTLWQFGKRRLRHCEPSWIYLLTFHF